MRRTIWLKRTFFGYVFIIYLIALFVYGVMQQSKLPAYPIVIMQVTAGFLVVFFSYFYSKKSIAITCVIVFIFQMICSFGLRYFNYEYFHDPLGYKPADALTYYTIASRYYNASLREFQMFMDNYDFMLDDRGMCYMSYFIYKIAGSPERGLNLAVFVNVCAITLSAFFCYKLARVILEERYAEFVAFLWGTQLYASYTAASGLKENFMVVFLVLSLYYIAKLYNEYTWQNLFLAILFAASALFFRIALFYMLLSSVLFVSAMKFPILRRYIYILLAIAVVLTWFSYKRTFDEMAIMRHGAEAMDYETYQALVEGKKEQAGFFASIVSFLSALIGPLPNIVSAGSKANYITLFSYSSLCKSIFAFYFLYSTYLAIKKKNIVVLSLLVFWFLEIVMLAITFYTLHDRYHWPHVPIVILLSAWGGIEWMNNKGNRTIQRSYYILVFLVLTVFNFR